MRCGPSGCHAARLGSVANGTRETPVQRMVSPRRDNAAVAVVAGVGIDAIAVSAAWTTHGVQHGPELCPFRALTGLPCPGCGLTRSWVFLGHGDLAGAFGFNAFGPVFFMLMLLATGVALWTLISRRTGLWERLGSVIRGPIGIAIIVGWLGYGVLRIVDAAAGWGLFPAVAR